MAAAVPPRLYSRLVFDCDGVLVDSERWSCAALADALQQAAGLEIAREYPRDFAPVFGCSVRGAVEHYAAACGKGGEWDVPKVAAEVERLKEGIYKQLTDEAGIAPFEGVHALVADAHARSIPVGIGSSGTPEKIAHNLRSAGLCDVFPVEHFIVSASYVARGKPHPDVYIEAARRLREAELRSVSGAGETVESIEQPWIVIEDAILGLQAARAAGALAVAVPNTLTATELAPHADAVVASLRCVDLGRPIEEWERLA